MKKPRRVPRPKKLVDFRAPAESRRPRMTSEDDVDFGEHHPIMQFKEIADFVQGGNFYGVNYDVHLTQQEARTLLGKIESLRPTARAQVFLYIMTSKDALLQCLIA